MRLLRRLLTRAPSKRRAVIAGGLVGVVGLMTITTSQVVGPPAGGGCAVATANVPDGPDPWGGCFPGPTTTGVPAGTTLTAYTGPCVVTTDNTVIDSKTVDCPSGMAIQAANVTIQNSSVCCTVTLDTDLAGSSGWSLTVTDSELDAGTFQNSALSAGNWTAIRVNMHGGQNGAQCDGADIGCDLIDSWIHDQYIPATGPWHLGGILSNGTNDLTITHNSITCSANLNASDGGCSGDVNLIPNFAAISFANITYNLLGANADSSYCTYGGEKAGTPTPNSDHIVYQHNIFQKNDTSPTGSTTTCAAFGPVTSFGQDPVLNPGNTWTDNLYDDGTTVAPSL